MNELTLTLIRVAFLAVLWLFVIAAIGVVRTDLSGNSGRPFAGRAKAGDRLPAQPSPPSRNGRGGGSLMCSS